MNQRNVPKAGEFYRHFKNNFYQIITIATHTETREKMVVYQALYGDFGIFTRPLEMFMEPVDKEKYPNATQTYRFELVDKPGTIHDTDLSSHVSNSNVEENGIQDEKSTKQAEERYVIDENVERFLDANSYREKINIVLSIRNEITEKQIHDIAVTEDIVFEEDSSLEEKISWLLQCLETQARFEIRR